MEHNWESYRYKIHWNGLSWKKEYGHYNALTGQAEGFYAITYVSNLQWEF